MLTHGAQIRLRKALDRPRRLVDLGRIAAAHPLSSNANLARIAVFQEKTEIKDRIFAVYKILILVAKLWTPSNSHPFNTLHSDLDHRRKVTEAFSFTRNLFYTFHEPAFLIYAIFEYS